MNTKKTIKAKPPYFIHFTANYPGYVVFSKIDYDTKSTEKSVPLTQLSNIIQSLHTHIDKSLHHEIDLSKIDAFLKKCPIAKNETEYHALVDFYNSPKLKELVKKTTERNADDYEVFLLREWTWMYIARKIFRPAFIQTDYSLRNFNDEAASSPDKINDFGRELY